MLKISFTDFLFCKFQSLVTVKYIELRLFQILINNYPNGNKISSISTNYNVQILKEQPQLKSADDTGNNVFFFFFQLLEC